MQRVGLIGIGDPGQDSLLQPPPLDDRRLEQRGRRVGVVLEQLRRIDAVVGEIEAAGERRVVRAPRRSHVVGERRRNRELLEAIGGHDVLDRGQCKLVQGKRRRLEHVDLTRRKAVAMRLVPVHTVNRVVREADSLAVLAPVGPGVTSRRSITSRRIHEPLRWRRIRHGSRGSCRPSDCRVALD